MKFKNPKYDGYQRVLAMVYNFFEKKAAGSGVNIPLEFNILLAKELHTPIIRNFKKEQFILDLKIWGADLYAINKQV